MKVKISVSDMYVKFNRKFTFSKHLQISENDDMKKKVMSMKVHPNFSFTCLHDNILYFVLMLTL